MHSLPPVPVVCAIIVRDGLIMLAQRPPGKKLGGLWEFPGGKVEHGENPEGALHRELSEELGCEVKITKKLPPQCHAYEWGRIELIPFVCELTQASAEPQPHEHTSVAWVEPARLATYQLAPADVPLLTLLA
jgi:8-oxo-dGTP diphosphatase